MVLNSKFLKKTNTHLQDEDIPNKTLYYCYHTPIQIDFFYKFVGIKALGQISKRVFQENKARQTFRKTNISYVCVSGGKKCLHVCVSGGKKCSFFGNFGVLCFLEAPVLRITLLPYYQWIVEWHSVTITCTRDSKPSPRKYL